MRIPVVAALCVLLLLVPVHAATSYRLVLQLQPANGGLRGSFGGLPATLVLSNGTFTLTTPLGTVTGTYTSTNGTLVLTVTGATGLYAGHVEPGTQVTLPGSGGTVAVDTRFRNHGAYVRTVAHAVRTASLPPGTARGQLVSLAARNQKALRELEESRRGNSAGGPEGRGRRK